MLHRPLSHTLLTSALLVGTASAQLRPVWSTSADGGTSSLDWANHAATDDRAATYVVGTTAVAAGPYAFDALLSKLDANGNVAWRRTYDIPLGVDQAFDEVVVDRQGRVAVACNTHDLSTYAVSAVLQYDSLGNILWRTDVPNPSNAFTAITALAIGPLDEIILVGSSSPTGGFSDVLVTKLSSSGTVLWTRNFDHAGNTDGAAALAVDASGTIYVGGVATDLIGEQRLYALKLDSSGSTVFETTVAFGIPAVARICRDIAIGSAGELYTTGYLNEGTNYWMETVAFTSSGGFAWNRLISAPDDSFPNSGMRVATLPDGGVLAIGSVSTASPAEGSLVATVWNPNGSQRWLTRYVGPGNVREDAIDLAVDTDGVANVLVCNTLSPIHSLTTGETTVVRFSPTGAVLQSESLGTGSSYEMPIELSRAVDGTLRVVAVWNATTGTTGFDALVTKLELEHAVFCFGDGSGTNCPCGNSAAAGEGCANSFGQGGRLEAAGAASLSLDSLALSGTQMPNASALYFQGTLQVNGGAGVAFGDGLRCVGGTVRRLGTKANVLGGSTDPAAGDAPISAAGQVTGPGELVYQVWYRNAASFCTAATFNLTNGVRVLWSL